ncbi:MAG TPA: permease-like cell division protein FtsX [bacterium]|mgnify:CR=1 FL=1|nr:permease-like cell division protein FtsX [bacterium]
MFLLSITRVIRFALQNFYRNIWLSLVTVTIIVLTLFSLTSLIVLNSGITQAMSSIKNKIDISIYLKNDTLEKDITPIKEKISNYNEVKEVTLISSNEALEKFKQKHVGDTLIQDALNELDKNPLGPTLTVKANDVNLYPTILERLQSEKIENLVEEIDYDDHKIVIERLEAISQKIRKLGLVISIIFAIISLLVVFNTIRIGIYTHKEEIGIMKLVGAGNWFVRAPFLLEAILYALLGLVVFWILFFTAASFLQPFLSSFFIDINFNLMNYLTSHFLYIFGFELIMMIILNIISSFIAIGKYLRV